MTTLAWHFIHEFHLSNDLAGKEAYQGLEVEISLPLILGRQGLHAASSLIDAIEAAPGTVLCQVELSGEVLEANGKHGLLYCAQKRKIINLIDISALLEAVQQRVILSLIIAEIPDKQQLLMPFVTLIKSKRNYLQNKITVDQLQTVEKNSFLEYSNWVKDKSNNDLLMLALWSTRIGLTEEFVPKRNKPIILGSLCQWLIEIKNMPNSEMLLDKFEKILIQMLKQSCPEFQYEVS